MEKAYDSFTVRLPKGSRAAIEAKAAENGKSINGYIAGAVQKVLKKMQRRCRK